MGDGVVEQPRQASPESISGSWLARYSAYAIANSSADSPARRQPRNGLPTPAANWRHGQAFQGQRSGRPAGTPAARWAMTLPAMVPERDDFTSGEQAPVPAQYRLSCTQHSSIGEAITSHS